MKKFITGLLLFFLFAFILPWAAIFILPSDPDGYLKAYGMKKELASGPSDGRILIAGGSNAAFAVNSRMIQDSLGLDVVNTSLHAGLGFDFIVREALEDSRPGDIVLLSMGLFTGAGGGVGETTSIPFLVDYYPEKFADLSPGNMGIVIKGTYVLLKTKIKDLLVHKSKSGWDYRCSGFNSYGDEEAHWTAPSAGHIEPQTITVSPDDRKRERCFDRVCAMISQIEAKGCQVWILPPVLQEETYEKSRDAAVFLEKEYARHGICYLFPQSDAVFGYELLFNRPEHANGKGVALYTRRLIRALSTACCRDQQEH